MDSVSFGIASDHTSVVFGGEERDYRLALVYEHSNDRLTADIRANGVWKGRKPIAYWSNALSKYSALDNKILFTKYGNLVVVSAIWVTGTFNAGTHNVLTIPEGWRPSTSLQYVVGGVFTTNGIGAGRAIALSNGGLQMRLSQQITDGYEFTLTYFID